MEKEILEEIKKTNRLLEKLIGEVQILDEPIDKSYHDLVKKEVRVP